MASLSCDPLGLRGARSAGEAGRAKPPFRSPVAGLGCPAEHSAVPDHTRGWTAMTSHQALGSLAGPGWATACRRLWVRRPSSKATFRTGEGRPVRSQGVSVTVGAHALLCFLRARVLRGVPGTLWRAHQGPLEGLVRLCVGKMAPALAGSVCDPWALAGSSCLKAL